MSTSITSSTTGKKTYKIVFLGDSNTGKTSIIERFVSNKFEDKQNPTIGIDFMGKNIQYKSSQCRLQLWDTAGQERFRSLIPSYLKDAACAIYVFDVSNPDSLEGLNQWIRMFKDNRGANAATIIVGNKSDLESKFEKKKLEALMQKHKLRYLAISAKTNQNIESLFFTVVDMINELAMAKKKKIIDKNDQESQSHRGPATEKPLRASEEQTTTKEQQRQAVRVDVNNIKKKRYYCC